jgi:squalene-hopene/tetraprenyl-beta-curcumene cyclase
MTRWFLSSLGLLAIIPSVFFAAGPEEKQWSDVVTKGINSLRQRQAEDGSFSKEKSPGITGIVLTAVLKTEKLPASDPLLTKGFKYVESLVNPKEGHLAGDNPRVQLKNYVTSVNVMALAAANREGKYKAVIGDAVKFLKELQWDDGEGKPRSDNFFGGAGYDSKSRPDLSNTQFFMEALAAAGVPKGDPAYEKALVFISRSQNLKSEFNDQPWAGKVNDGGFIYTPAGDPESKADEFTSYGSMTYAGIKSMIYAGVDKDDKRVKAGWEWIRKNYSVEQNPGMPKGRERQALFYYYHTMAKTLHVLGVDYVEDANGVKHDWRKELASKLAELQSPDGSWTNEADRWMEGDPSLTTGYALLTLSYCKPTK